MDEQTSTAGDHDEAPGAHDEHDEAHEGTFVGGGFDRDQEQDEGRAAVEPVGAGPQDQGVQTSDPGPVADEGGSFPSDVEGTSTEPTPGELNDPV